MKRKEYISKGKAGLNLLKLFGILSVLIFAISCSHDEEPDGPNLEDRFGPFMIISELEVNRDSVDFASGQTVLFNAEFNKNVNWIITITGNESGAVKRIEGFSRIVNSANAVWNGNTTQLPFFKIEMCNIELTIPEEVDFSSLASIEISSTRIYPGTLFTDFEQPAGSNITLGNFEFELTNNTARSQAFPAAHGDFFYLFEGTDNVVPNFFTGLIVISPQINGTEYVQFPTTVPENLYFNFFLYNDGRPYGIAVIQFAYDTNDNGVFNDGVDQTFQLTGDFPLNFTGWKQFSHTMADVGLTQELLQKIVAIRVLLISDMNSQPTPPLQVQFGIDYMTFTSGAPLSL